METLAGEIKEMDRISHLPDSIVHRILSGIGASPAELVQMSVLSKTWFHLTASFPILDFSIHNFRSRETFFKYVDYTTSRFCQKNVTAQTFKLITTLQERAELDVVNRCLELVFKKGVKVLEIIISNSSESPSTNPIPKYCLPNTLLSVSMLEYLIIHGCDLPSSLMVDEVKFKSLICLELQSVHIDDEVIKYLTTSCPLLKQLVIRDCHGFQRFCVYGHQNLQTVAIYYSTPVERIDIEAPNLSDLIVADWARRGATQMNLVSCQKLTTVTFVGNPLPNSNGFTDFLSNFPFIENLYLATAYKCNNLKLSSHSLRILLVHPVCDFGEIEFDTPNLVLFGYSCSPRFLLPLVRHSTHLKGCMHCYLNDSISPLWFQKLRQFSDKKNGFKVSNLYIHAASTLRFTRSRKRKVFELPPYKLEHVELQLDTHEKPIAFVDVVLRCCRPQSLTLRSSFPLEEQSDVVKFTYKKLLEHEDDQGHTKIHIVSSSSSGTRKHLMDLKSLSMALPREGNAISFIKEEGIQEEVG